MELINALLKSYHGPLTADRETSTVRPIHATKIPPLARISSTVLKLPLPRHAGHLNFQSVRQVPCGVTATSTPSTLPLFI